MSNSPENNTPENEKETPTAGGGKQTRLDPMQRKTGMETSEETREGAAPEAPGARNDVAGDPNQGTDAR